MLILACKILCIDTFAVILHFEIIIRQLKK